MYVESDSSPTTMTQRNPEEKKFALSPQAAEFVPRAMQLEKSFMQSLAEEPNTCLSSVPVSNLYYFNWIFIVLITFDYFDSE